MITLLKKHGSATSVSILKPLSVLLVVLCFHSCAKKYYILDPSILNYPDPESEEIYELNYIENFLYTPENERYFKIAEKKGVEVLAVEIVNHSSDNLIMNQNTFVFQENKQINLFSPDETIEIVYQKKSPYLWYLLLGLISLSIEVNNFTATFPLGLVAGVFITIRNWRRANRANQDFLQNLITYKVQDLVVPPGEKRYAIIAFSSVNGKKLTLRSLK
ncbi:hypothetical protein [Portibacter marinus]|uniref:hypothetical protein n=1 Tax=Portibacter marinus TaxID=2898660 RepID=UPI001F2493D7|nr:hypothetical protein [Portibacter marinus]